MAIITGHAHAPLPAPATDSRQELRAKSLARLSGAAHSTVKGCNPHLDPRVNASDFVTAFDLEDDKSNVRVVNFTRVTDNDIDW